MMRRTGKRPINDKYDVLQKQIDDLTRRLDRIENQRRPSIPIYDSANFPAAAQEGEIAIAPIV